MTIHPLLFQWVADLVRVRSAIQIDTGKEYLVEGRLQSLVRQSGAKDLNEYLTGVRADPSEVTLTAIVDALTTNETSWFRDALPFRALTERVVPEALSTPRGGAPLRIWSAACSSGQEPYSIAIALTEMSPSPAFRIVATDLSNEMLNRARAGRYNPLEVNRGLPAPMLVKHFKRQSTDWEVNPALRTHVTFAKHNLLDPPPDGGPFDVIFLRNVLIYFDLPTKQAVLRRVQRVLRPGGYLILGAAETTLGVDDTWERVPVDRSAIYRTSTSGRAAA